MDKHILWKLLSGSMFIMGAMLLASQPPVGARSMSDPAAPIVGHAFQTLTDDYHLYLPAVAKQVMCKPYWRLISSPNPNGTWYNNLNGVTAIADNDVWAVGSDNANTRGFSIHWNGVEWETVPVPRMDLHDVDGVASNDVWAVGGSLSTGILHWDGTRWTRVASPSPTPISNMLYGIDARAANDVWTVGGSFASFVLHWDGMAWSSMSIPELQHEHGLSDVAALAADDVWAVGYHDPGSDSRTLTVHWDGRQWEVVPSPNVVQYSYDRLQTVVALASDNVWAGGGYYGQGPNGGAWYSLILHWNGTTWTRIPLPDAPAYSEINDMVAFAPDNIWAVGGPYVWRWDGATWSLHRVLEGGLNAMTAVTPDRMWAVGTGGQRGENPRTLTYHWTGACP